jgi:hypothetical protein
MEFEGEFMVPGKSSTVITRFTDIDRMSRCLPGASLEGQDDEGNYVGVMTVAFGPKRLKFKGRLAFEFDLENRSGLLRGRGAADMRAARVSFETAFTVTDVPLGGDVDEDVSAVKIMSKIEMGGVIADFASTGGAALANVLMKEFAKNLAEELIKDDADPARADTKALSAHKLIWSAVKTKFS